MVFWARVVLIRLCNSLPLNGAETVRQIHVNMEYAERKRNMEGYKIDAKTSGTLLSLESQCRKKQMPTTARVAVR